jgi:general secretion pathway protein D
MIFAVLVGVVSLQFEASPVQEVADAYEECTGLRVMVYPELAQKRVTVRAMRSMAAHEAAQWIRDALELEGVEIVQERGRTYMRAKVEAFECERYTFRSLPVVEFLSAIGAGNQPQFSGPQANATQAMVVGEILSPGSSRGTPGAPDGVQGGLAVAPMQQGGILGAFGLRVVPDYASNAITCYGQKAGREKLLVMAREMDQDPAMVELEVIIAEYTFNDSKSVGVDWAQVFNQATESLRLAGTIRGASLIDLAQVRSGSPALFGGEGLTVFGQVSKDYTAVLQALAKLENFRILQRPKLQTLNHKEANIFVGERVPIPGRTVTETASVSTTEYLPVRLELTVTPHLLSGGKIRLDFKQSKNDITGFSEVSGDQLPNISEQGVQNIVVGGDAETVFLGGLRTRRDTETTTGVPGLVKVPGLRVLFGSRKKGVDTKEILLFVTPRVRAYDAARRAPRPDGAKDITNLFGK